MYLALPPPVFAAAITAIAAAGLPEDSAIVIEKPFGQDLASAQALNELLARRRPSTRSTASTTSSRSRRSRTSPACASPTGSSSRCGTADHIERIEITFDESLALEGRAGYYDHAGALRDMIQNHLLQVMALVAMEPPPTLDERDLRDRKVEVLRAIRTPTAEDVAREHRAGALLGGHLARRPVPDYANEEGVDPANGTETYARGDPPRRELALAGRAVRAALRQGPRRRRPARGDPLPGGAAPHLRAAAARRGTTCC